MHTINLEKYTSSVTFYFKDCSKDDVYISLSITNSMLEYAEPMSILVFLIFFNYLVKTLFIFIFILLTSSSLVFIMVWYARKGEIVVAVAIQSVFRLKMHQNDIFLFFKSYFWDQHIKTIRKYKKKLIFSKKN
jgi:hypothetical protein